MNESFSSRKSLPELEKEVLDFWDKEKIFEKSIKARQGVKLFNFYDGPPFATGLPHYGHLLATTIKDVVTRYKTMRGFLVARRVGWDCHGLPVENLVEKSLKIKSKKAIEEEIGVEKFNEVCRASVFSCVADFSATLKRVGRWADYSDAYATMDAAYTESVWWVFKQLWDAGLVYKSYRVANYCPRCGTTISNFEVNQGYRDTIDPSIFVKFKLTPFDKVQGTQENIYFLVWTTTPWTLPANVALAVGEKIKYVKVEAGGEKIILAKKRLDVLNGDYKIVDEVFGKELKGIAYEPFYSFVIPGQKSHFVILADFVSTEEGTGIVHIAPAFGEDDLNVGRKNNLPVIMTIDNEGKFLPQIKPWAGKFVKDADEDIVNELRGRGLLFKKERINHLYPFCWRCESPLLYMALDSWYIKVTEFKNDLARINKKINWQPRHIKEGRFGKWLAQARDWDFARSRYWGAPLPIWQCQKCKKQIAVSSRQEILSRTKGVVKLLFVRHGQAESNAKGVCSGDQGKADYSLTANGRRQLEKTVKEIKNEKVDLIFSSDFLRTKQSAEFFAKKIKKGIIYDKRLRDIAVGSFEGKTIVLSREWRSGQPDYFEAVFPGGGESLKMVGERMVNFLDEIGSKYQGKTILIVSHQDPIKTLYRYFGVVGKNNLNEPEIDKRIGTGSWRMFYLNNRVDLSDLHRPYIDKIDVNCECGGRMRRVKEVFDCWFESGAMPYAQWHYPFENKELVEKTFPADFIAEGMDQTRGWFYTLTVLAAALTRKNIGLGKGQPAFKNVIVNGIILAENGQKLSKRLKNYPDPSFIFDKYGADAMRFFLMSSTPIGEDYLLSEKRLAETWRRTIMTLWNTYLFFDSYRGKNSFDFSSAPESKKLLDKWVVSRVNHHSRLMEKYMDEYDLTRASRVLIDLTDDLSNWYVRRSRRRFQKEGDKSDKETAIKTLGYALQRICLLAAPFTPFISEVIYKNIGGLAHNVSIVRSNATVSGERSEADESSVHLADFPQADKNLIDEKLENSVSWARKIISLGLAARAEAKIKVRQPLAEAMIKQKNKLFEKNKEILTQIYDELNVKKISFGKGEKEVDFDFKITPELRQEGLAREVIRQIQAKRKELGFSVADRVVIEWFSHDAELANVMESVGREIADEVGAKKIIKVKKDFTHQLEIEKVKIRLDINKV